MALEYFQDNIGVGQLDGDNGSRFRQMVVDLDACSPLSNMSLCVVPVLALPAHDRGSRNPLLILRFLVESPTNA